MSFEKESVFALERGALYYDCMMKIDKQTAAHYHWGDDCDGWFLLDTANLTVIEERVPPGKGEVKHVHTKAQQFFYVLQGVANIELDGTWFALAAGQSIHIPPGIPHQLVNNQPVDLRFLVISNPKSHADKQVI